jgi:hypothetical protein
MPSETQRRMNLLRTSLIEIRGTLASIASAKSYVAGGARDDLQRRLEELESTMQGWEANRPERFVRASMMNDVLSLTLEVMRLRRELRF